ncbi:MAG: branched-chain amino acid ABC transporter permease [Lachnospiraceae bacterium]|jgi:branched-chain amino acid transport system permease protein|nr:branched-chain amino acid ABC transporter permease [Lachnospiraceae bacterium]
MNRKSVKLPALGLIAVCMCFLPQLLNNTYYQQVLNNALIYTIVVLGLNFITGLTGQMVLGMSGVFAIGAYVPAILLQKFGWTFLPCLLAVVFSGILVGVVIGFPCLRLKGIYLAICTMGFGEIVRICATNLDGITGGAIGLRDIGGIHVTKGIVLMGQKQVWYVILAAFFLAVWFASKIHESPIGMTLLSLKDNETASSTLGIHVMSQKLKAFVMCCVFAAIAGMLYSASTGYIAPTDFSYDMSVRYVMMLIIGGIGTVPGAIIGGITVTIIPEILRFADNYYWLCFGAVTVLMVVLKPYGLYSVFKDVEGRLKKRKAAV